MLALIGTILGLLGSFLPEVLKFFKQKEDHRHELAILSVQAEMAKSEHLYRMEEINVRGDIASEQAVYKNAEIKHTGIKFVDGILALWNGIMRPWIATMFVGTYILVKYAQYKMLAANQLNWEVVIQLWNADDMAVFSTIIAFYFGGRFMKYALGQYSQYSPINTPTTNVSDRPTLISRPKPADKPKPGEISYDPPPDNTSGY